LILQGPSWNRYGWRELLGKMRKGYERPDLGF
jgi:hypothetical protein